MDTVYVKPSEGARIRQPDRNGQVMPEVGALVPRDSYYERLLIGGDIVETDQPKVAPASQPAPADKNRAAAPSTKD